VHTASQGNPTIVEAIIESDVRHVEEVDNNSIPPVDANIESQQRDEEDHEEDELEPSQTSESGKIVEIQEATIEAVDETEPVMTQASNGMQTRGSKGQPAGGTKGKDGVKGKPGSANKDKRGNKGRNKGGCVEKEKEKGPQTSNRPQAPVLKAPDLPLPVAVEVSKYGSKLNKHLIPVTTMEPEVLSSDPVCVQLHCANIIHTIQSSSNSGYLRRLYVKIDWTLSQPLTIKQAKVKHQLLMELQKSVKSLYQDG
jgi:hypothetical protein